MGRRDAVQVILEFAAEWRRLGAEVTFEPGWERRGNGYGADYEGCLVHHTGSESSEARPFPTQDILRDGRPGLTGPLCNSAGPVCPVDRPRIHVMAAFPANHAGASGGRAMGPLPVTSLFNPKVWGHEIDYAGTRSMSAGQYRAALIAGRGVANVLGRSTEYVRAHAETSVTGKWDPGYAPGKTIDMAAFRRDAAALQEDDVSAADVWNIGITHGVKDLTGSPQGAGTVLGDIFFNVRNLVAAVGGLNPMVAVEAAKDAARDAAVLAAAQSAGAVDPQAVAAAVREAMTEADFPTAAQIAEAVLAEQERAELEALRERVRDLEGQQTT